MPASLITDDIRELIGRPWPPVVLEVDRSGVRMWARAVGFDDPVFYDDDVARDRGFADLPAPPGFVGAPRTRPGAAAAGPPIRGLHPDLQRSLNGGTEFEYMAPIVAGDVLSAVTRIVDVEQKDGTHRPDAGVPARDHLSAPGRGRGDHAPDGDQLLMSTPDDIVAVDRQVFADDVSVGMELPELVKRCSPRQLVMWAAASGDFYEIHYDVEYARSTGLPGLVVHGALKHAFLGQLVHDWVAPGAGSCASGARTGGWTTPTATSAAGEGFCGCSRPMPAAPASARSSSRCGPRTRTVS